MEGKINEPGHSISYKCVCAPSEDSDQPGPKVVKLIYMLNSADNEICPANKSQINLKLLTIANSFLLNIAEHENFSANEYENANYGWHFHVY